MRSPATTVERIVSFIFVFPITGKSDVLKLRGKAASS